MDDDTHLIEMLTRYVAGDCTPEEVQDLSARLERDPDACDLLAEILTQGVAVREFAQAHHEVVRTTKRMPQRWPGWLSWRPLTAAAAGIVLGMFCTSVVFGYVGPRVVEKVKAVFSEGFESGMTKTAPGVPRVAGQWSGDEAEVVTSTPEVKAHGGAKMLRFLSATYPGENSPRSQWGDVYRIVDVRGLAGAGSTVARASASFARGAATGEERFACRVEAYALDQDLGTLPPALSHTWLQQNNSATGSRRAVLTSTGRWQEVSVELQITRETRFVVLHLAMVQEEPTLKSGGVQFPSQFMDDVKVELITRP
ncbi:MAG: hypothetical protein WCF18_00395 [Chthoniobacteraceae bacterium]